jgi:hypothetical protein
MTVIKKITDFNSSGSYWGSHKHNDTCSSGHHTKFTPIDYNEDVTCNVCNINVFEASYSCRACNYDVCISCSDNIHPNEPGDILTFTGVALAWNKIILHKKLYYMCGKLMVDHKKKLGIPIERGVHQYLFDDTGAPITYNVYRKKDESMMRGVINFVLEDQGLSLGAGDSTLFKTP